MPLPYLNRRENQLRDGGRMPVLHWERFRPTEGDTITFAWWCIAICAFAVIVSLGLDALRCLPSWIAILLGADIVRWWYRFGAGKWYVPSLRLLTAPWTVVVIIAIVLPMVAHSIHFAAWWAAVIGIASWRMIRVGQKVRTHYLDYALENAGLSVPTRTKWKALRESDWRDGQADPVPSRAPETEGQKTKFLQGLSALRGEGASEILFAIVAAAVAALSVKLMNDLGYVRLRGNSWAVLNSVCIASIGALAAFITRPAGCSVSDLWRSTWHALHVFCQSPPSMPAGSRAPWSERSRYGDAENRRAYLVWNAIAIAFLILAATVIYPLVSDPLRDSKIGEYPITGTWMGIRLLELRFDRFLSAPERWVYFGAVWAVPVFFIWTGLLSIVGSTAHGARILFDNDDALEHD